MELSDAAFAARVARGAGDALTAVRHEHRDQPDLKVIRDAGDRAAQLYLSTELAAHRPDDAVLSEEADDDTARLSADRVWIIDPLDGTREFAEGLEQWAVHVALWEAGDLTVAAVALPGRSIILRTDEPPVVPANPDSTVRMAVSRSRATPLTQRVGTAFGAELVPLGSAGYKVGSVVLGEVDAYLHTGGQYEWDSAAPVAVARAAGLHTSRVDGSDLRYNRPDPYLPDLLVCRPELASDMLAACAELVTDDPTALRS